MLDLIQQNPLTSFVIFLIPLIGGTWKVLDVLFVKPRDFRIAVLEKNVEEMRKEFQKSSRTETALPNNGTSTAAQSAATPVESQRQVTAIEAAGTTLLNDLSAFYAAWRNPSLTELQREHFEKTYIGQKVIWRARLGNVSEEKNGLLWVGLNSIKERDYSVHVIAVFDLKHKEALLLLNKDEIVTVSATINSFYLSPLLKDCSVVRAA
jgi:hypothetical protein